VEGAFEGLSATGGQFDNLAHLRLVDGARQFLDAHVDTALLGRQLKALGFDLLDCTLHLLSVLQMSLTVRNLEKRSRLFQSPAETG
jgi:hypothetical protein